MQRGTTVTDDVASSDPPAPRPHRFGRIGRIGRSRSTVLVLTALFFGVAVVAYLRDPIFRGGYFFPGNASQDWGLLLVKGHYQSTILRQTDPFFDMGPWLNYNSARLAAGHLPLWNPYNGAGVPHIANLQSGFFSPWNIPFYTMPTRIAFILSAALRLWMLGVSAYLLLRELNFRWLAAAIGGLAYMFGGNHLLWLNWSMDQSTFVLPFGCWCLAVAARTASTRVRRWCFVGLALSTAASFLAGHVETFAWATGFTVVFGAVMMLARRRGVRARLHYAAGAVSASALGMAVTAIQLLPFLQYMANSYIFQARSSGANSFPGQRSFPGYALAMELYPHLMGPPAHPFGFPAMNRTGIVNADGASMGVLVLLLGLVGLFAIRHRDRRWMVAITAVVVALVTLVEVAGALGNPWASLPVIGTARPSRSVDAVLLGMALLAALGVEELQRLLGARRRLGYGVVALVGMLAGLLLAWRDWNWISGLAGTTMRRPDHVQTVVWHIASMSAIAAAGITLAIVGLAYRRVWLRVPVALMLLVCVGTSTLAPWWHFSPTVPGKVMYPQTPAIAKLQNIVGKHRVYNRTYALAIPDVNLAYRVATGQNYDVIDVEHYRALYQYVFGRGTTWRIGGTTGLCKAQLRLFGFSYVLGGSAVTANDRAHPAPRDKPTRISDPSQAFRMHQVAELGPGHVPLYHVPQAPMFGLAQRGNTVAPGGNAVVQAGSCNRVPGAVIIDAPAGELPAGSGAQAPVSTAGSVRVARQDPEHIRLSVTTPRATWLVARQTYYPGWQAHVDGARTRLWRADTAFQAVHVPAGTHTVTLDYRPRLIPIGAGISIAALVALAGWVSWGLWGSESVRAVRTLTRRRGGGRAEVTGDPPGAEARPDAPDATAPEPGSGTAPPT